MPPSTSVGGSGGSRLAANAIEQAARSDRDNITLPPTMRTLSQTARVALSRQSPDTLAAPAEEGGGPIHLEDGLDQRITIQTISLDEPVDFHALTYLDAVDENLLCPICKNPFVKPVITPCDHTFCFDCLKQSCDNRDICPIDRQPFRPSQAKEESRLIKNQLDNLIVECPNKASGCDKELKREAVVTHVRNCEYQLVPCPDGQCTRTIHLRLAGKNNLCLHYPIDCELCHLTISMSDMAEHLVSGCEQNTTTCECGEEIPLFALEHHEKTACPETIVLCDFNAVGCTVQDKRVEVYEHAQHCPYRIFESVGKILKGQAEKIEELQQQNERQGREIWDLKHERRESITWDDVFHLNIHGPKYRNADEAVMGIYEEVERRVEEVKKNLTDLEGRQTVMVLNQVMPIKDQIAEIRSNLGVLKMHVAWLMNKSREEVERSRLANRNIGGGVGGGGGAGRGRGSSDSDGEAPSTSRRLSDGSNGIPRL